MPLAGTLGFGFCSARSRPTGLASDAATRLALAELLLLFDTHLLGGPEPAAVP